MDRKSEEQEIFDKTITLIDKSVELFLKLSPFQQVGTVITFAGTSYFAIPKVPLIRALILGFRSLIRGSQTKSLRSKDVEIIGNSVHNNLPTTNDQFLIVRGPKGIGKTRCVELN